jgi:hypothetical protein
MTTKHPITPPPVMAHHWADMLASRSDEAVFTLAAQWGADQELEACCDALNGINPDKYWSQRLRAARRPKPPSLKEQALAELEKVDMLWDTTEFSQETLGSLDIIRRALEELPD